MTAMTIINYSQLRKNLASVMDDVTADGSVTVVTRQKSRPVVMMSYDEFTSWQETLHLMRSPANAARLQESIDDANAGRMTEHDLIEPDDDPADRA